MVYRRHLEHRKALELQLDVLTFSNRVLGSDHQETAKSKNNIACTYAELGDLVQAELFMRGAVSIWSGCHPPGHPELRSARLRWDQLKAALVNTCQKKQKAPSPNAPCPCGSGKKHKKCKCVEYHHWIATSEYWGAQMTSEYYTSRSIILGFNITMVHIAWVVHSCVSRASEFYSADCTPVCTKTNYRSKVVFLFLALE